MSMLALQALLDRLDRAIPMRLHQARDLSDAGWRQQHGFVMADQHAGTHGALSRSAISFKSSR